MTYFIPRYDKCHITKCVWLPLITLFMICWSKSILLFKPHEQLWCYQLMELRIEEEIQQRSFSSLKQKSVVNLIYTYFWVKERIVKSLKPFGITMQQYNVLRILKGQYPEGITTSDIRDRMLDKMSDASRLVDRLAANDLVEKRVNFDDRRLVCVRITERGLALLDAIITANGNLDGFMNSLTVEEHEQLNLLLNKLRK